MTVTPRTLATRGADGIRLRVLVWDAEHPRGRVLVVHGRGEHAGRYDLLAAALVEAGWTVVAYDHRGHGASEGRRGTVPDFERYVDDLEAVHASLDEATGTEGPVVLFGHSMGGLIAARYLQRDPPGLAAAILSAPWLATALHVPWWRRLMAAVLRLVAPDFPVTADHRPENLSRDPERIERYRADPLVHGRISARLWFGAHEAQEAVLADRSAPRLPLLVILPGADPVVDTSATETWARGLDGGSVRVERFEGRRHEPHNDLGREAVFELLIRWLDEHTGVEPARPPWVSSTNPTGSPVRRGNDHPDDLDSSTKR